MTAHRPDAAGSDRPAPSSAPGGLVKSVVELDRVVIRLAGDSGDGMQLTGNRFTSETASFGNDLSTLPNFPAEIRAPTGTLPGVSSFQLHFADHDIMTPGDAPDVLVVMNPAALKANLADLPGGGLLIVDSDEFTAAEPGQGRLRDQPARGRLAGGLAAGQRAAHLHDPRRARRTPGSARRRPSGARTCSPSACCRGCTTGPPRARSASWSAPSAASRRSPRRTSPRSAPGYNYGETTEAFAVSYEIKPAPMAPGRYRNISGNQALSLGLVAAGQRSGLPVFLGAYPITPASDILHELSKHKAFDVRTFQAEDEIAGIGAALGASFGGALGHHDDVRARASR